MREAIDTFTSTEKSQIGGRNDDQSSALVCVFGVAITGNVETNYDISRLKVYIRHHVLDCFSLTVASLTGLKYPGVRTFQDRFLWTVSSIG